MIYRVIPNLLIANNKLVKGEKFKNHRYIGDPINALRLFNDLEVDEIVLFDISTAEKGIDFEYLEKLTSECFVPLSYGGGINHIQDIERLIRLGFEKVILNSALHSSTEIIFEAASKFGSQAIIACVDVRKSFMSKYYILTKSGEKIRLKQHLNNIIATPVGEIIIQCVDREGTLSGFDTGVLNELPTSLSVPLIVSGGFKDLSEMQLVQDDFNVQGVSAGAAFVFYGPHRAVLINYPKQVS